jgi:hypothetical protein
VDARAILVEDRDIHISILVRSAPAQQPEKLTLTTQCTMIFTVDESQEIPSTLPERTAEDARLAAHAREIVSLRSELTRIGDNLLQAEQQHHHVSGQSASKP